jgi:hypothetical protein
MLRFVRRKSLLNHWFFQLQVPFSGFPSGDLAEIAVTDSD